MTAFERLHLRAELTIKMDADLERRRDERLKSPGRASLSIQMDAALARRREKRLREFPKRSAASLKGWATRKEMGL